jgi:hypothetical protein
MIFELDFAGDFDLYEEIVFRKLLFIVFVKHNSYVITTWKQGVILLWLHEVRFVEKRLASKGESRAVQWVDP